MATRRRGIASKGAGLATVKKVWEAIDPDRFLEYLNRIAPDRKWEHRGASIVGCCPYHSDRNPSLNLNFTLKFGKCFGCGKVVLDLVQLVANLTNDSYSSALVKLNTEFNLTKAIGSDADGLAEYNRQEELKKAVAVAHSKLLEEYIRDKPKHLSYFDEAVTYLTVGRNLPVAYLPQLPVYVWAKPAHVKKYLSDQFSDEYERTFRPVLQQRYFGSLCFTYNNSITNISRFKFRFKSPDTRQILANQKLSEISPAAAKALFSKEFEFFGRDMCQDIGVFGLFFYARHFGSANTFVYVTEGEFDALSIMAAQLVNGSKEFPVFAAGGGAGTNLSFLRSYSIRNIYFIQDAPAKQGDLVVSGWLRSPGNHQGDQTNPAITYRVFSWPVTLGEAGDLDEAVQKYGYDTVRECIYANRESSFSSHLAWVQGQCDAELDGKTDQTEIAQTVRKWYELLCTSSDKTLYLNEYSNRLSINFQLDPSFYVDSQALETFDGAVKRLVEEFSQVCTIPSYQNNGGTFLYTVYVKRHRSIAQVTASSDNSVKKLINACTGMGIVPWVKSVLRGALISLPDEDGKVETNPIKIAAKEEANCLRLVNQMLELMRGQSIPEEKLVKVGQGIHFSDLPGNNSTVYIVNGDKVYKGVLGEAGVPINWTCLNNILDNHYRFDIRSGFQWSHTINDVSDLYSGTSVDLHELFEKLVKVIDTWKFQNHDVMRHYIACLILTLPIQLAINKVSVVFITGESTSGKTSFVQGLLGGGVSGGHDIPYVLESSVISTDATPAYIYQSMDCSSLMLGLDEAETNDTGKHNEHMRDIMKLMYSVSTGGSRVGRGSATPGSASQYNLKVPVLLSAITMPSDPTFLTRVMVLYTEKLYGHFSLSDRIIRMFPEDNIDELRRQVTTCLLHRLPEIMQRCRALSAKLRDMETDPPVTMRFIDSIIAALVVYEMCGYDPIDLYLKLIESNKSRLREVREVARKSDVLNAVLFGRFVQDNLNHEADLSSPRDLILRGGDNITLLNNSRCGVYVIPEREWIVIYWRQVREVALQKSNFRFMSVSECREGAARNEYVKKSVTKEEHKFIVDLLGIPDASSPSDYTVLGFAYLNISKLPPMPDPKPDPAPSPAPEPEPEPEAPKSTDSTDSTNNTETERLEDIFI